MNIYCSQPEFKDWLPILKKWRIIIVDDIVSFIQNSNGEIVLLLNYKDIELVCNSLNLKNYPNVYCSNYDVINILNNKVQFHNFMIDNGFNLVPNIYKINNKSIMDIKFPCIFKLIETFGGNGSKVCHNNNDLMNCDVADKNYFVQEYIVGKHERTLHLFVKHGKIMWSKCYEMEMDSEYHIQRGKMKQYKVVKFNCDVFKDIFKVLKYTGFACVDFKILNGEIKIFEINPRLGGSLVHGNDFRELIDFIRYGIKNDFIRHGI